MISGVDLMNIYKYETRKKLISTLIWIICMSIFILIFYSVFETMGSSAMADMFDEFPEAFLKAFGMSDNFSTIIGYTAMICIYIVLCGAIFSCNLGLNAVSIEERDLTADFLISKPVTRNRILTAKLLAALTHMLIFSVMTSVISFAGIEVFKNGQEYLFSIFLLIDL